MAQELAARVKLRAYRKGSCHGFQSPDRALPARRPLRRQGRRAARAFLRVRPDQIPSQGRDRMAEGAGRRAAFCGNCRFFAVDRGSARCAGRQLRAGTGGRGEGHRSRHQPRRQGAGILDQGQDQGQCRSGQGQRVHPLRLHFRRHQQPVARADVPGRPRTGHAADARTRSSPGWSNWPTPTPTSR